MQEIAQLLSSSATVGVAFYAVRRFVTDYRKTLCRKVHTRVSFREVQRSPLCHVVVKFFVAEANEVGKWDVCFSVPDMISTDISFHAKQQTITISVNIRRSFPRTPRDCALFETV